MAAGASMYATLEPCNHFGRTNPCTEAIIAAGVTELHAALRDPNPNVTGRGLERLEESGVRVRVGEQAGPAERMIEAYLKHSATGMPFVTAKFAASLDGKIATRTGDSKCGAEVVEFPGDYGGVDLQGMLRCLGNRGNCGVMVEGGGTLLGSLFDLGLVDKVVAFVAPIIIGGSGAPSPVGGLGVERLSDALRLEKLRVARFGRDTCVIGYC